MYGTANKRIKTADVKHYLAQQCCTQIFEVELTLYLIKMNKCSTCC